MNSAAPVSGHEILTHKHNITRLGISKHMISDIIGICILQAA